MKILPKIRRLRHNIDFDTIMNPVKPLTNDTLQDSADELVLLLTLPSDPMYMPGTSALTEGAFKLTLHEYGKPPDLHDEGIIIQQSNKALR